MTQFLACGTAARRIQFNGFLQLNTPRMKNKILINRSLLAHCFQSLEMCDILRADEEMHSNALSYSL